MSTSLLYHGFGLVGYRYRSQRFEEGRVIVRIDKPRDRLRCAHCGSAEVWAQGGVDRTFSGVEGCNRVPHLSCYLRLQLRHSQLLLSQKRFVSSEIRFRHPVLYRQEELYASLIHRRGTTASRWNRIGNRISG